LTTNIFRPAGDGIKFVNIFESRFLKICRKIGSELPHTLTLKVYHFIVSLFPSYYFLYITVYVWFRVLVLFYYSPWLVGSVGDSFSLQSEPLVVFREFVWVRECWKNWPT